MAAKLCDFAKDLLRMRKHVLWFAVVLVGTFLIYAQIMNTNSLSFEGSHIQSQRFLYLVNHQDEINHKTDLSQAAKNLISFFPSSNITEDPHRGGKNVTRKAPADKSKENRPIIDTPFQKGQDKAIEALKEKQNASEVSQIKNENKSRVKTQEHNKSQRRGDTIYRGNGAAAWNGGSFRYNPYGEPVYNHDNRPSYVPKERVVHFDLKGAPPLPFVYKSLIPWLAKIGATSILMEYEDMFPWEGPLAPLAAKNHYTKEEIKDILTLCEKNLIRVIPLVQTFGHLEFALKLPRYSFLREVSEMPQALCPSKSDAQTLIKTMIDQIMALHKGVNYLHIGCDEVFQIGECELCRLKSRENLFLSHVAKTAEYVLNTYGVKPIIWHDMLNHIPESLMKDYNMGHLVEPMVWVYAEDVYRFVPPSVWAKFSRVFPAVWGASAFKGAFGEQTTVPNVRRHLDNNLNWLDVLSSERPKFTKGIKGLVLTGWQRHDHFAVLCELFPSALPSLAVNLIAISHGYFNATVYGKLYEALNCMQTPKYQTDLNLDSDPFLWDKFSWCYFHGSLAFKSTARLDATRRDVRSYIDRVTLKRAWLSDYNRRHNFSSPMRIEADLEELPSRLHAVKLLIKTAKEALSEWFDEWTTGEWIEQHIWPLLDELETLKKEGESMKLVKTWPQRPLPLLKELAAYEIKEPIELSENNSRKDHYVAENETHKNSNDIIVK